MPENVRIPVELRHVKSKWKWENGQSCGSGVGAVVVCLLGLADGEVWGISENTEYLYDFLLQYLKGHKHLVFGPVF